MTSLRYQTLLQNTVPSFIFLDNVFHSGRSLLPSYSQFYSQSLWECFFEALIHWALTILVEAAGIEPASVSPLPKALHA